MSLTKQDIDIIIPQNVACKQTFVDFFTFYESYGDVTLVCNVLPTQNSVQNEALPISHASHESNFKKCSITELEITKDNLNNAALDNVNSLLEETENLDPNINRAGIHAAHTCHLNEMHANEVDEVQSNNSFESIKDAYTASM